MSTANSGNLNRRTNNKVLQAEVAASHRPQSVRELNDWFRIRTVQEKNCKCLALQESTRSGGWRTVGKCGQHAYDTIINYLQQFVPVD